MNVVSFDVCGNCVHLYKWFGRISKSTVTYHSITFTEKSAIRTQGNEYQQITDKWTQNSDMNYSLKVTRNGEAYQSDLIWSRACSKSLATLGFVFLLASASHIDFRILRTSLVSIKSASCSRIYVITRGHVSKSIVDKTFVRGILYLRLSW